MTGVWNQKIYQIISNPSHSTSPWFYKNTADCLHRTKHMTSVGNELDLTLCFWLVQHNESHRVAFLFLEGVFINFCKSSLYIWVNTYLLAHSTQTWALVSHHCSACESNCCLSYPDHPWGEQCICNHASSKLLSSNSPGDGAELGQCTILHANTFLRFKQKKTNQNRQKIIKIKKKKKSKGSIPNKP